MNKFFKIDKVIFEKIIMIIFMAIWCRIPAI